MEMYMTGWNLSVFDTLKHEYKTLTWMGRILSSDEAQNIYEIIGTEFNSAESQTLLYREIDKRDSTAERYREKEDAKQQLGFGNPVHFVISQQVMRQITTNRVKSPAKCFRKTKRSFFFFYLLYS